MRAELKRILIGWVLLMTFMPFFVVKAVHHHNSDSFAVCASSSDTESSEDNCRICDFTLSPFTDQEPEIFDFVLSFDIMEPVPYCCMVSVARQYFSGLRAPPATFC